MDYIEIEVPDMNDSSSRVLLGDLYCRIRFTYIDSGDYWTFGVYDDMDEPIAIGIKIVPQMVLNMFFGANELPYGLFGVYTNLDRVGRDDFKNGNARFVFFPLDPDEDYEDEDDEGD